MCMCVCADVMYAFSSQGATDFLLSLSLSLSLFLSFFLSLSLSLFLSLSFSLSLLQADRQAHGARAPNDARLGRRLSNSARRASNAARP